MDFSAILAGLYLQAGIADMSGHTPPPVGAVRPFNINIVENPYGVAEVGWSVSRGKLDFEVAARHMSSLSIDYRYGDFHHQYGTNTFEARVRWYPWRP
jgi:hypothetical protein